MKSLINFSLLAALFFGQQAFAANTTSLVTPKTTSSTIVPILTSSTKAPTTTPLVNTSSVVVPKPISTILSSILSSVSSILIPPFASPNSTSTHTFLEAVGTITVLTSTTTSTRLPTTNLTTTTHKTTTSSSSITKLTSTAVAPKRTPKAPKIRGRFFP